MSPLLRASATAVLLVLVAGCGDGDGGGDGGKVGAVSKADYLAEAEAICKSSNAERKQLETPTSVAGLAPYVSRVVAIADGATSKLRALTAPAADAAELQTKVLGPLEEQLSAGHTYADQVAAAAKANDTAALGALLSDPPTKTRADLPFMKDYGFDECVKAADTGS